MLSYITGEFPLCTGEKDCTSASSGTHENTLLCPSGTLKYRDGFNNCEFEQCDDPRCELEDYKQCQAPYLHVYVARDPKAGASGCAEHIPCPGSGTPDNLPSGTTMVGSGTPGLTNTASCSQDVKTCPDGQTLNRDPMNNCEFPMCTGEKDCSSASTGSNENFLQCPSGTLTYRDPYNNCEFAQCDDPRCELEDYKQCPSPNLHVYVARVPELHLTSCAAHLPCPGSNPRPTPGTMSENTSGGSGLATITGALVIAAAGVANMM